MTDLEQLSEWVDGRPVHGNNCCPDFSCCQPQLLAPPAVRELFAAAHKAGNEEVTMRMLMEFLGKAFSSEKVYIAGLEASRNEVELMEEA